MWKHPFKIWKSHLGVKKTTEMLKCQTNLKNMPTHKQQHPSGAIHYFISRAQKKKQTPLTMNHPPRLKLAELLKLSMSVIERRGFSIHFLVSTHLKNMLVKMGSSSPRFGVKIPKIFELPPSSFGSAARIGAFLLYDVECWRLETFINDVSTSKTRPWFHPVVRENIANWNENRPWC